MVTSQVKALLYAGGADTSPESAGHVGFFLWGYVPEPYTCSLNNISEKYYGLQDKLRHGRIRTIMQRILG